MIASLKTFWLKLCVLLTLLLLWSALSPVHACTPEIRAAISKLQKSARVRGSADIWLAQVIDETKTFTDIGTVSQSTEGKITGAEIARKNLWEALFPYKQALFYLKEYLGNVKIRHGGDQGDETDQEPRIFPFHGEEFVYSYNYPDPKLPDETGSACQLSITVYTPHLVSTGKKATVKGPDGKSVDISAADSYTFGLVDGKMKLISNY